MTEEAHLEAAAILRDAGWTPHPEWGVYTRGTLIMGGHGGSFHVKDFARIPPEHPLHSEDTPDTPEEAAQWLVTRFGSVHEVSATLDAEMERDLARGAEPSENPRTYDEATAEYFAEYPDESNGETGENAASGSPPGHAAARPDDDTAAPDPAGEAYTEDQEPAASEMDASASDPIDADFTVEDLAAEDDLLADEDFDLPAIEGADVETEAPAQDGPIAYGASTIDGLVREKLGRVSQIARELKAVQQEGWTVEEFAYLQNLIVRMDRGEAPNDDASRDRFLEIGRKSQAMSRIDQARDKKEGELEEIGQRRDFDAAVYYEPGDGWPG